MNKNIKMQRDTHAHAHGAIGASVEPTPWQKVAQDDPTARTREYEQNEQDEELGEAYTSIVLAPSLTITAPCGRAASMRANT